MKTTMTSPCNDCPFRRKSLPGWLGPWDPNELLDSIRYVPFPCHKTIPEGMDGIPFDDDCLSGCAGAAIYLNNKLERSRCPPTATHQDAVIGVAEEVKETVFANAGEFLKHHKQFDLKREG